MTLACPFDHDHAATELVLQARVGALGDAALAVPHSVGGFKEVLVARARIVIDQRYMAQAAAVGVQLLAAIGCVHYVVQVGGARGR